MGKKRVVPNLRFEGYIDAWEQRKLGEMGSVYTGNTPLTSEKSNWNIEGTGYLWITPTDIKGLKTDFSSKTLSEQGWNKSRRVPKNSVLITSIASIGKNTINMKDAAFNQQINAIVPVRNNPYFILMSMERNALKFASIAGQTATAIINKTQFEKFSIMSTSLEEQTRIGSFFQEFDNLIAIHQRKLELLQERKKAYLQQMFPKNGATVPELRFEGFSDAWEQRKLGEMANRYDNLRIPVKASDRIEGDTPYYGANGIQGYVDGHTHEGEFILVAEDGANDLKDYPVQYTNGKIWVNNHAHVLQGKENLVDNKFLMNAIKSINIEPYLVGGGRAKLNADVMMKLEFLKPSIQEQTRIGAFFQEFDNLIAIHQRKLELLQERKKAYLQQMFV